MANVVIEALPFDTTQVTSPQNGNNPKWGDPCHPLAATGHPPTVVRLQGSMIGRADKNGPQGDGINGETCFTLNTIDRHAVVYTETYQKTTGPLMANSHPGSYSGQDAYTDMFVIGKTPPPIQYIVRRLTPTECARLQGFPDWWDADVEGSDSARYKMWGNGIALPCAEFVLRRIAEFAKIERMGW